MTTRNVNLTATLDQFVEDQVRTGAFQNASEVARAGLRSLKAEQDLRAAKIAALNAAIQEGIDSGPPVEIDDVGAWLDGIAAEVEAEVAAEEAAARTTAE